MRIAPFSNRLALSVPSNVQRLRCLANYEALQFSEPIRGLAENMVNRMVKNSSHSGGKYVSIHLRFEEVLLFHSIYIYINITLCKATFASTSCKFISCICYRIWLHFLVVLMMVAWRRSMRWIKLEKGVGEENLEDEAE